MCVCVCGLYSTPENANFDFEIRLFFLLCSWKLGMKSVSSDGAGDCRITAELLAAYTHIPVYTLQCLGGTECGRKRRGWGGGGGHVGVAINLP